MRLVVNGEAATVRDGATVAELVAVHVPDGARVAAARNGEVVPRTAWTVTVLADGDHLELLTAVQGG